MMQRATRIADIRAVILTAGVALSTGLVPEPATAEDQIDPKADKILGAMSSYMDGLNAITVSIDVDNEVIDTTGQKRQFSASTSIAAQRPKQLHVHRRGPIADMELFYDGKMLTIHGKGLSVYMQSEHRGTIVDARISDGYDQEAPPLRHE